MKELQIAIRKAPNTQVQQILLLMLSSASDALAMAQKVEE